MKNRNTAIQEHRNTNNKKEEKYNIFFAMLAEAQKRSKAEYLHCRYDNITLVQMLHKKAMKELIVRYNLNFDLLHNEDLQQESYIILHNLLFGSWKDIETFENKTETRRAKKINAKTLLVEETEETTIIREKKTYNFKNCPSRLLFNRLTTRLRDRLKTIVLKELATTNKNVSLDASISLDRAEAKYIQEIEKLNLAKRLEDKAQQLQISSIEMLSTLEIVLSKSQYRFLVNYVQGKKQYDSRTIKKIRATVANLQLTYTEKQDIIYALYSNIESLDKSLRRLSI